MGNFTAYSTRDRCPLVKVTLLGLLILSSNGCSTSFQKLDNSSERFYRQGFSILPPQGKGWLVKDGHKQKISFFKKGAAPKSSYVVMAFSSSHKLNFESEKEFEQVMGKLRLSLEFRPKRNTILQKHVSLAPDIGKYCLKSYSKMQDFGKKTKGSDEYLLMENFGLVCLHPQDKSQLVNIGVTYRYPPGAQDKNIKDQAEKILVGVQLEALHKVSIP